MITLFNVAFNKDPRSLLHSIESKQSNTTIFHEFFWEKNRSQHFNLSIHQQAETSERSRERNQTVELKLCQSRGFWLGATQS